MNTLPDLIPGQLLLVVAPEAAAYGMLDLAARLSQRGALQVLDGGNQFNAYHVANAVRRRTTDFAPALARIQLARVFTCYQMETLLLNALPQAVPTLVMDFLSTFTDENVSLEERIRLLERCARHLRRLSQRAPVVVSVRPARPGQDERLRLTEILRAASDQVYELQAPASAPALAPRLF